MSPGSGFPGAWKEVAMKPSMRSILWAGAALSLSAADGMAQQQGSSWVVVTRSQSITVSIDPERIRRSGKHLQVWSRWEFRTIRTAANGRRYRSRMSRHLVDCDSGRTSLAQTVLYDASGGVVGSFTAPSTEW